MFACYWSQPELRGNIEGRLALFKINPNAYLSCFITVNEIWIHHNTPLTKYQMKQWPSPGESAPKKAKVSPSANKVMMIIFWNAWGIIHIVHPHNQWGILCQLMDPLNNDLKKGRPSRYCSSIKTIQVNMYSLKRNLMSWIMNCFLVHHVHLI